MAGKSKKAESVVTRKQKPKKKEDDKKIPLTGKGVVKKAAPKVGLVAKKRSGGEAKKDTEKVKKETPQKTKGKKETVRCRVIVKGGPKKKRDTDEKPVVKTGKNATTPSKKKKDTEEKPVVKTGKKADGESSTSKVEKKGKTPGGATPSKKRKVDEEASKTVKRGRTKVEQDEGPSTSKVAQKAKKPAKKPAPPSPRGLSAAEEKLLAAIEEEERKGERLREELEEKNERVKALQVEEKEAKKEKAMLEKAAKAMRARLKALDRQLAQDNIDIKRATEMNKYHQEMIDLTDRRLMQLQAIQDQRNIQSAHRGREALTHRVLNRQLKRYLAALRTCIIRMADGHSTPFIDRLLEIAQEDYSPMEEHRRIRDMMRSIGIGGMPVMGRRVMQVDLTDL